MFLVMVILRIEQWALIHWLKISFSNNWQFFKLMSRKTGKKYILVAEQTLNINLIFYCCVLHHCQMQSFILGAVSPSKQSSFFAPLALLNMMLLEEINQSNNKHWLLCVSSQISSFYPLYSVTLSHGITQTSLLLTNENVSASKLVSLPPPLRIYCSDMWQSPASGSIMTQVHSFHK